jgi:hypothetical protein
MIDNAAKYPRGSSGKLLLTLLSPPACLQPVEPHAHGEEPPPPISETWSQETVSLRRALA